MENVVQDVYTSKISASSSLTVNLGNYNSARIEMTIEKTITNPSMVDIEKVKKDLWDEVNNEVDNQVMELKRSIK